MSETTKIWDTWDSTPLSNVAYKRSWRKKLEPTTPDLDQDALERRKPGTPKLQSLSMIFDRFAARYRASLTTSAASAPAQLWGAAAPLFLKERRIRIESHFVKISFLIDRSHPLRK